MTTDSAAQGLETQPHEDKLVIVVSAETMGRGDDDLGRRLLVNHLHTLSEIEPTPHTLVLLNTAVRLATEGSQALKSLQTLADRDTTILLCRTCLEHFNLADKVAVGQISSMYDITEVMLEAAKVITL